MTTLLDLTNAADKGAISQTNFEALDDSLAFKLGPTKIGDPPAANTIKGPPVAGTWAVDEVWVDSLRAKWVCTVAGTPGTWQQIEPAFVAADPAGVPAEYWIRRTDQHFKERYYDGAAWQNV
jgi:hypothetical protein